MIIIKAIPNLLTLLNLSCGFIGIQLAVSGDINKASYLIWLAVVFDFGDGFAARMLNAQSPIGKQLDSLADLVSFGVLPGFIYYSIFEQTVIAPETMSLNSATLIQLSVLLVPILSALRLAKFNIDENQTDEFIGLSTTAHAIFISALVLAWGKGFAQETLNSPFAWLSIMTIGSILLVSPIRLLALKFKSFGWRENWMRYFLLILGLALILGFKEAGVALTIVVYIVLSMLFNLSRGKN